MKYTILIDDETENLAFTGRSFEDCDIDDLIFRHSKGIVAEGNVFKLPIEQRKAELHHA